MPSRLSQEQVAAFKARLNERRGELLSDIRAELLESDNSHYVDLAERVHDVAEESVADLLSDLDLAVIDRHISELRDIEEALQRIAQGTYGTCLDCSESIDYARLDAYPTAKRCYEDQKHYEQTHAGNASPRL